MREICRLLDIEKLRTTAYHPACNGVVERFHRTLNTLLGKVVSDNQGECDLTLPFVMAAYRASVHESTGYSPNFIVFGREVRTPVDAVYGISASPLPATYSSYSEAMLDRMQCAHQLVREHLQVAAERNRRHYNLKVRNRKCARGDCVYYYNPRKLAGRQDKWRRKFSGQFLVVKVIGDVSLLLQKSKRTKPFCCHIDKVKPYNSEVLPDTSLPGCNRSLFRTASQLLRLITLCCLHGQECTSE